MQSISTPQFSFSDIGITLLEDIVPFNTELFFWENKNMCETQSQSNESSTIGSLNETPKSLASASTVIKKFSDPDNFSDKCLQQIIDQIQDPSTDLNELIGEIINEADQVNYESKPKRIVTKKVEKRKRKSKAQLNTLMTYFKTYSSWEKANIAEISQMTGLSKDQVYKWYWDQKRQE